MGKTFREVCFEDNDMEEFEMGSLFDDPCAEEEEEEEEED